MRLLHTVLILVTVSCLSFNEVRSLNILGLFPYEGKSHFFVFQPYLLELAKRGHNVTTVSHFPQKTPQANYTDISLAGKSEILENVLPVSSSYLTINMIITKLVHFGTENCKLMLGDEQVQNLWKSNAKFDLIIVEEFNSDCAKGLAHVLGAPTVAITSHVLMPWHYNRLGIPYNPSYVSFMFLEGGTQPTLYQRIERVLFYAYSSLIYTIGQRFDQNTLAQYFDGLPPLEELSRQVKLTLLYQNMALVGSTLTPSNFIEVGGYHVAEPKALPEDLKKYIEESKHGVIYISFGSMLKAASTPRDKIQHIIDAMAELPQRVIWKWEEESLPGNPEDIYISKWLPQNDILAHPNVVAFYSHCGLLGTTEAITHGVPLVGMPIFGDQPSNAAAVEESGFGVQIQFRDLTKDNLLAKFKKVLDPKFRENVKRLSKLWQDRPMSSMDSAIWWTEFAARNPDINLRSRSADVPYYQFLCLDVIVVLALITFGTIFALKFLVGLIFRKRSKSKRE